MKLKNRAFPFWAVGKKTARNAQKCYRFVGRSHPWNELFYDCVIKITKGGSYWEQTNWYSRSYKTPGSTFSKLADSTVQGMKELSYLESGAKQRFIVELWKIMRD